MEQNRDNAMLIPTISAPDFQKSSGNIGGKCEKQPIPFTGKDALFSGLSFLLGYSMVSMISIFCLGTGVTVFSFLFLFFALAYFKISNLSLPKASYGYLLLCLLSSINFSLISNGTIKFFNFVFLMGITVYWVAVVAKTRVDSYHYIGIDLCRQLLMVPFHNFSCAPKILKQYAEKNKKGKKAFSLFGGILLAVPLLAVVVFLLMRSDATFEFYMDQFFLQIGDRLFIYLWRLLPAFLIGCYLFGLLYGNLKKRYSMLPTIEKLETNKKRRKIIPVLTTITVLGLLCTVYILFFIAQTNTLFSAFAHKTPDGITYAEYARRGFFELCFVAAINLAVTGFSCCFTALWKEKKHPAVRVFYAILSAETLLLIASALSKMTLYVNRYGLTSLRVYSSWFMVLLAIIFLIFLFAQFRNIPVVKSVTVAFCIWFLILCYGNVDSMIVQYNIARYQNQTLAELDVNAFYEMPEAAAPYAVELYKNTTDFMLKEELADFLCHTAPCFQERIFWQDNLQHQMAVNAFREYQAYQNQENISI